MLLTSNLEGSIFYCKVVLLIYSRQVKPAQTMIARYLGTFA